LALFFCAKLNKPLQIKSIAIIGAGSWATALCKIFSESGIQIHWWFHRKEDAAHFSEFHQNPRYLSDVDFKDRNIQVFSDLKLAVNGSDSILIAVPSAFVGQVLQSVSKEDLTGKKIISSIKGILPGDLQLVTDYLAEKFQVNPFDMAVIGGPCHAEEVALEKQSYLTVAANDESLAIYIKELMQSRYISVKTSNDPDGLEWAAVLKNVYAIACGVCHGLGYGDNFQAVLVANAMQEMNLFLQHCAPKERDPLASAYLGDLLVTAYSTFSRNRTFGNMVGRGYGIKAAQVELGMIAEGYYAIEGLYKMKEKFGIQLPIADAMYSIMYQNAKVNKVIGTLKGILS